MRSWILAVWFVLAATASGALTPEEIVGDGHVRLRVSTEPAREVVLGQQTRIFVEILTDTWFTKAPLYPELSLPGAVALMPEQLGTNFSERIEGTTFAAQRRSYVVYPQRAGTLEIPPIPIRLGVAVDAKPSRLFTLTTPPLKLQVVLPREAEAAGLFVTTPELTVDESWDRSLDDLRVGDALKRTLRVEADDALAMLLPAVEFEAPPGVALYRDQPRTNDRVNRGQYQGERVDAVTYVLQRSGEFQLPELQIHWWNTGAGRLETVTLEARTLTVAASDLAEAEIVARTSDGQKWRALVAKAVSWLRDHVAVVSGAVALGWLAFVGLRRRGPGWVAAIRRGQRARSESESAYFQALSRDVGRGDEAAIVQRYWQWRERLQDECPALDTSRFQAVADSCGFREVWSRFEQARYAPARADSQGPDSAALSSALSALRKALRAPAGSSTGADRSLNPRGLPRF